MTTFFGNRKITFSVLHFKNVYKLYEFDLNSKSGRMLCVYKVNKILLNII